MSVPVVTIDGPAASGKSSVSRGLAQQMGWKWVSTGAFYRGLACVAQDIGVSIEDEAALVALAESKDWKVVLGEQRTQVFYGKKDMTDQVYTEETGSAASKISHYPLVRKSLLQAQRDCAIGVAGLVAEGRDCGTVVFPSAPVKIFLTAHSENRAVRRAKEEGRSVEETQKAQQIRDRQDSTRQAAPLQVPEGAVVVDTSEMGLNQVIDHVVAIVRKTIR